ncbi:MAG TPA: hypothetical protein VLS90_19080 [Thermodesulfobacteriota bacterium]|nr:hypothetical protein [Thermodesulfobacteriota bacterium]
MSGKRRFRRGVSRCFRAFLIILFWGAPLAASVEPAQAAALLREDFEDADFSARGWYDGTGGALSTSERVPGSGSSFECRIAQGAAGCEGGSPGRRLFTSTEIVNLSFRVKYTANYVGSGLSYGPHEFYILTDRDSPDIGPAGTHLTTYIEQNAGIPRLGLQDMLNVDTGCILKNDDSFAGCGGDYRTYRFTEKRSVASCNGLIGPVDGRDCFPWDAEHWYSARYWRAPANYLLDNRWHDVRVFLKMNSVVDGIGIADGHMKYAVDGNVVINYENILFRTGANADMKFNQFIIGPYMGSGSPVDQTFWLDNLAISTDPFSPGGDSRRPTPPQNLRIQGMNPS